MSRDDATLRDDDGVTAPGGRSCDLPERQRQFLETLFSEQRGPLLRHVTSLMGSRDDAAEVVQETFFRLVRHAHATGFEVLAQGYLFQTATNLARDHFRRRAVRHGDRHVPLDDAADVADDTCVETSAMWNQALAAVKSGLQQMPGKLREVFFLSRFEGRTYPEIAQQLAVSTRTVERRMTEALDFLAAFVREAP